MTYMWSYLRALFTDVLFWRVSVSVFALPFIVLGAYSVAQSHPMETTEWVLFALLASLGIYGACLFYAAVFGSDSLFARSAGWVGDGDLLGILVLFLVCAISVPITVIIRLFKPRVISP